jgi:hypothetical protein
MYGEAQQRSLLQTGKETAKLLSFTPVELFTALRHFFRGSPDRVVDIPVLNGRNKGMSVRRPNSPLTMSL